LRQALSEGYGNITSEFGTPDADMLRHLHRNVYQFSVAKNYSQMRALTDALLDDEGRVRPFSDLQVEALKIDRKYNVDYLRAEYDTAVGAAEMASEWASLERQGGNPMLRYVTAGDERVRESHRALNGLQRPMNDPIWNDIYPPNGWRCRCTVTVVSGAATPDSQIRLPKDIPPIFRTNLAKTGLLFPNGHPYFNGVPSSLTVFAEKQAIMSEPPEISDFSAKTVAEAEKLFVDKFGVKCSFKGFTKADMWQIKEIYDSARVHFAKYPELRNVVGFIGSASARVDLVTEILANEYRKLNPNALSEAILKAARRDARRYVGIGPNTYAYSHGAYHQYGLDGIAVNSSSRFKGNSVLAFLKNDSNKKFHPLFCDTYKSVIDHEFGHRIDALLEIRELDAVKRYYAKIAKNGADYVTENLSKYGYKPIGEFIAECWSEYINSPTPREIARTVGDMITKKYNEKYGH